MTVTNGGGPSKHYFVDQNDVQEVVLQTSAYCPKIQPRAQAGEAEAVPIDWADDR